MMKLCPLILLLLVASTLMAQEPDSTSALFKMREAERNFARESIMLGRNAAFVKNFADISVIFTDKWITNGKHFWKNRKNVAVVLKWEPEFMDLAGSRDFGISTGPWESQEYRPNTPVQSTGYFLTVWKKEASGIWKVILDAGSETPAKVKPDHRVYFPQGADKPVAAPAVVNVEKSVRELLAKEKSFLIDWKKTNDLSVYLSVLEPGARMQLSGHLPTTNTDSIKDRVNRMDKNLKWNSKGAGAASSGDIGYTYGLLESQGNPATIKGHYVRIWKKHRGGNWKIALEMITLV